MKRIISILATAILTLGIFKARAFYQKFQHAKKLQTSVTDVIIPQKLKLQNVLGDTIAKILLSISNFSPSTFEVQQIQINIYSDSGKLIAEQTEPLTSPIVITPSQISQLRINVVFTPLKMQTLIREAGGFAQVLANKASKGIYGITLQVKGFALVDGFATAINKTITV